MDVKKSLVLLERTSVALVKARNKNQELKQHNAILVMEKALLLRILGHIL